MRFLSIVKSAENQGTPPQALLDAIAKLTEAKSRDEALEAARTFMRLHQQHWPGWDGECEIRELVFLAPGQEERCAS